MMNTKVSMAVWLAAGTLLVAGPTVDNSQGAEKTDTASVWEQLPVEPHGFLDVRAGMRTQTDTHERDTSLSEARLQLELYRMEELFTWQVRADFLYDDLVDDPDIDLEAGDGWLDLREAYILATPHLMMDVKLGRQILTWGTGDLLFINDLFPKDWQSFFAGRDEEYLKAPSDALLVSLFPSFVNMDVAYMPRFDADRFISGERLSYWNPVLGTNAGRNAIMDVDRPDNGFEDDEWSVRAYRTVGSTEIAVYGYDGFWKSPQGFDAETGLATFPRLRSLGASVRRPLGKALISGEAGYYDSRDDSDGTDPLVPNSETRLLVGYERELMRNLTAATQYYVEILDDYDAYRAALPEGQAPRDEDRHVVTLRLTQRLMNQNLTLSMFAYYSPSDEDAYLRPRAEYKLTDNWLAQVGGNVFLGEDPHTFFGQFEDNSNIYGALRYSF